MRRRRRYSDKAEINIVPLLDVLLVLVLVFMATAPIITQSVEVDLPESSESKTVSTAENIPVIIEVSNAGYSMIINQERKDNLSKDAIITDVKAELAKNEKTVFLIGGAKDVPYEEVIKALNLLQSAGVKTVSLMTQSL